MAIKTKILKINLPTGKTVYRVRPMIDGIRKLKTFDSKLDAQNYLNLLSNVGFNTK
ncbi:MAG: hypothetical protein LBQ59_04430 [Candidatus Peribacteria bacterium]|nr:hypothetical protein [Candidatus Peribacteria bacterium]